jgi:hypothetical protein
MTVALRTAAHTSKTRGAAPAACRRPCRTPRRTASLGTLNFLLQDLPSTQTSLISTHCDQYTHPTCL